MHKSETLLIGGIQFQKTLDATEAFEDAFGVIHAIDADAEKRSLNAELGTQSRAFRAGAARFVDASTIMVDEVLIRSRTFLITTGARPKIPSIAGLNEVPFMTYEQIFDNDRLPRGMVSCVAISSGAASK